MEKKDNFIWTSANYFEIMLHREIVSGSKQHKAIRKMRNRFKTDPPKKNPLKRKTNNKVLVFFFFSLFFLREAARLFPSDFVFLTSKQKKSLGLQVHRLICPGDSPNSCQSQSRTWAKQSLSAKMSLHCENQTQRPGKKPCTDCLCILSPLLLFTADATSASVTT